MRQTPNFLRDMQNQMYLQRKQTPATEQGLKGATPPLGREKELAEPDSGGELDFGHEDGNIE